MAGLHTDKPILFICDPGGSYLTASNPNLISNLKINFLKILLDRAGLRGEEDPTKAAYIRIVDAPLIKVPFLSSLLLPPSSFNSPSPSTPFSPRQGDGLSPAVGLDVRANHCPGDDRRPSTCRRILLGSVDRCGHRPKYNRQPSFPTGD